MMTTDWLRRLLAGSAVAWLALASQAASAEDKPPITIGFSIEQTGGLSAVGKTGVPVHGRGAGHRHRPLRQRGGLAFGVVGGDQRLASADQHPQAEVVALRPLGFLDRSLAQLDRKRHRAHRHRVGGVGSGAPRRLDQPRGQIRQGGLVERR